MRKKKVFTIIVPLCIVAILSAFCWWGYNRLSLQEEQAEVDLFAMVPTNCEAMVEVNDVNALCHTLHEVPYIHKNDVQKVSALLALLMDNVESLSKQQAHGLSTEMNRQLLISFHQPGSARDQVIYGRYAQGELNSLTKLIQTKTGNSFSPKKTKYKGEEIIVFPIGNDFMACYLHEGAFAISFQKKLIEKVIDTYASAHEESLHKANKETKHNEQLALYLPTKKKDAPWRHYEIRMNADAIYLTGKQMLTEMNPMHTDEERGVELTEGELLPHRVMMMVQTALHTTDRAEEEGRTTLSDILKEHQAEEVTSIQFTPMASDTVRHQLLMITLPANGEEELRQALRYPLRAIKRPSIWRKEKVYPIWQCKADTALWHHFIHPTTTTDCWISLYQNHLLVATNRETLQEYMDEMHLKERPSISNQEALMQCLDDLAEEANYTLVADMSHMLDTLTQHCKKGYTQIPPICFKHREFFKQFMLSAQQINHDGQSHSQMILKFMGR